MTQAEIGSSFELVESAFLTPANARPLPWEDAAGITYVESGRQALAVAETGLRRQGHRHLHVPSYLCDSMISPFQSNGWLLTGLPLDDDLVVNPAHLLSHVADGVLLHAPYFGRQDSPAMLDALETLRRRGVVVVVDETHRVFSGPSPVADIRVASLRKSLPLFDGGYVTGMSGPLHPSLQGSPSESSPSESSPSESRSAALREMAMRAKSGALTSGDGHRAHRALFAEAERETEIRTHPASMSQESLSLLHRLDLELIRTRRRTNSTLLATALGQHDRFRVINPPAQDVLPFYLVLETGEVRGLQRSLAGQRIYCPVHWPASALLPRTRTWPSRYISLPVDHRYGGAEMLRMAACIRTFFGKTQKGPVT